MTGKNRHSISQLRSFNMCKAAEWAKANGLYEQEITTSAMAEGLLGHAIMENQSFDESNEAIFKILTEHSKMLTTSRGYSASAKQVINSAENFLTFDYVQNILKQAGAQEQKFVVQEQGYEIVGKLDMYVKNSKEIKVWDWKFVGDFKDKWNNELRMYQPWYQDYINQLLIYAYLMYNQKPKSIIKKPISLSLVGIEKSYTIPTVEVIELNFGNFEEMVRTYEFRTLMKDIFEMDKVLNQQEEPEGCGTCPYCRAKKQVKVRNIVL